MRSLCIILMRTFAAAIILTQITLFAAEKAGLTALNSSYSRMIVFVLTLTVAVAANLIVTRTPSLPSRKLAKVLEKDGYSDEFYAILGSWQKACGKKGVKVMPSLTVCELLLSGKRYTRCFEALEKIDYKKLSRTNRQIYFNIYLYGSLLYGDLDGADKIYSYAKPLLVTVSDKAIVSSVKHTLGCYEYAHGRLTKAEELFSQSLDHARSDDVRFENYLGLSLCYLDTERLSYAKNAVLKAEECALSDSQRKKLQNVKRLVEEKYREAL